MALRDLAKIYLCHLSVSFYISSVCLYFEIAELFKTTSQSILLLFCSPEIKPQVDKR